MTSIYGNVLFRYSSITCFHATNIILFIQHIPSHMHMQCEMVTRYGQQTYKMFTFPLLFIIWLFWSLTASFFIYQEVSISVMKVKRQQYHSRDHHALIWTFNNQSLFALVLICDDEQIWTAAVKMISLVTIGQHLVLIYTNPFTFYISYLPNSNIRTALWNWNQSLNGLISVIMYKGFCLYSTAKQLQCDEAYGLFRKPCPQIWYTYL